jgi:hypothetical protein
MKIKFFLKLLIINLCIKFRNFINMATASSHLSSDKVNLLELKDWLRREFLSFFEDCSGKKCIIWDNQLTQPLGLIADYKVLKVRLNN